MQNYLDEVVREGLLEEVTFRLRLGEWEEFSRVHSRQTESVCEGVEVGKSAEWSKNRKKAHVAGSRNGKNKW